METPSADESVFRTENFTISIAQNEIQVQIIFLEKSCMVWIGAGSPEMSTLTVRLLMQYYNTTNRYIYR
jgi:hypothetical protein